MSAELPTGDQVRALGHRLVTAYGIDADAVLSASVELTAAGVQVVHVRLVLTAAALEAMRP